VTGKCEKFVSVKFSFRKIFASKNEVPTVKSVNSGKLLFLESIRGLAAFGVVIAHLLATYYPGASTGPSLAPVGNDLIAKLFYGLPFGFVASGHFAVIVFFVLSGFVLTYKFYEKGDQKDLHTQAAKRYFRLAIPIFAIVMVSYLMMSSGAMSSTQEVARLTGSPEAGRIFNFIPSLSTAFHDATIGVLMGKNVAYNPVLWTMSIEFIGSFVVFGLAALVGKLKKRWLIYIGAIIVLGDSYYVCFIIGMALSDLVNNTNVIEYVRQKVSKFYLYGLLLVALVLASFPSPTDDIKGTIFNALLVSGVDSNYVLQLWQFFAAAAILFVVLSRPELQRILSSKILVFLGGISFALYLTHYLVLHSLGDWLFVTVRANHGLNFAVLIAAVATVAVTIAVSVIWKKYVDDTSVSVSRRFAKFLLK